MDFVPPHYGAQFFMFFQHAKSRFRKMKRFLVILLHDWSIDFKENLLCTLVQNFDETS